MLTDHSGKSSVLEALTEINFPRADNTCTLFATEIILRRATSENISVKILPDPQRSPCDQQRIRGFSQSISDFSQLTAELGAIIEESKACMGIGNDTDYDDEDAATFARDVLRIEIQGSNRPQLTVVDLPGLIQNETRHGEKEMLDNLTKQYLEQSRTICLPVITATNDADNQRILTFVKEADPAGHRSLGIITKPDTLPAGSGSENAFMALANNEIRKYSFKLGWHVLKNRGHEHRDASFTVRNKLEAEFFQRSNFNKLPAGNLGIKALGGRLSLILFDHIKRELPSIRSEVEGMLAAVTRQSDILGPNRGSIDECRAYLFDLSLKIQEICRCALNGHYEHEFFKTQEVLGFERDSGWAIRRLRALVQHMNEEFASGMRDGGHTLNFELDSEEIKEDIAAFVSDEELEVIQEVSDQPIEVSYPIVVTWAHRIITRSRGKELQGNYNPLVISELFWVRPSVLMCCECHADLTICSSKAGVGNLLPKTIYARSPTSARSFFSTCWTRDVPRTWLKTSETNCSMQLCRNDEMMLEASSQRLCAVIRTIRSTTTWIISRESSTYRSDAGRLQYETPWRVPPRPEE